LFPLTVRRPVSFRRAQASVAARAAQQFLPERRMPKQPWLEWPLKMALWRLSEPQ
jgi:hypothetical protein